MTNESPEMERMRPQARVFICYARVDMAFVDRIVASLEARGIEVFIDRRDPGASRDWSREIQTTIAPFHDWWKEIQRLITEADTVVFVISPESVISPICQKELAEAASLNKRVAPIAYRPVGASSVPEPARQPQWIDFEVETQFEANVVRLAAGIENNIEWIRKHTELGVAAQQWDVAGRPGPHGLLLRPPPLTEAETWLGLRPRGAPELTEAMRAFIRTSRAVYDQEEAEKKSSVDRFLIGQSRHFSDLANESMREGDASAAIMLALAALPDQADRLARPYVAKAETTLFAAVHAPRDIVVLKGHNGWVDRVSYSADGLRLLTRPALEAPRLWDARTGREIATLGAGGKTVHAAAFDPTDQFIMTACHDHLVRLWNSVSGQFVAELPGHDGPVRSAAFSPDGALLVSTSDDGTVRLWSVGSKKELRRVGDRPSASQAIFSPDGRMLALKHLSEMILFSTESWRELRRLEGHSDLIEMAVFSPDSIHLATASGDRTARLWSVAASAEIVRLEGHSGKVQIVGFSPDGQRLITGGHDNTARIWACPTGKEIAVLSGHKGWVTAAAFSPDSRFVMTASFDKTVRIWEPASGKELAVLGGHDALVAGAVISPDSQNVATASWDWTARVWTVWGSASKPLIGHQSEIRMACFSSDDSIVATACADNRVGLWDTKTGENIAFLTRHHSIVWHVVFNPDGTRLVSSSSDNTAIVWDVQNARSVAVLSGHSAAVLHAQFSPDGSKVVTASEDNLAIVWNSEHGSPRARLEGHRARIIMAAFSPDSRAVLTVAGAMITSGPDDSVRLWDSETGRQLAMFTGMGVPMSAEFSRDGKFVAIGYGGIVPPQCVAEVWSCETFRRICVIEGHLRPVCGIHFSSDSQRIVTASFDGTARVWESGTGRKIAELRGHSDIVRSAVFGDDDRRILTASSDKTARIWDATTSEEIAVLRGHTDDVRCAAINRAADQVLTASYDRTARLWRIFKRTDELIEFAKRSVARALTREQLESDFNDVAPPIWWVETEKWPYDSGEWQLWLAEKKAGRNVPVPAQRFYKYG
jgi:WD40 repeat protein